MVPQAQGALRAAVVHGAGCGEIAPVRAAHGDLVALGQREDVLAARHPRAEPGVELDQGTRPRELGGREGQIGPLDGDHPAGRVPQPHHRLLQHALDRGALPGRAAGDGDGRQRVDGAPAEQLAQGERQFGRVERRPGGQRQHPGRDVDQIVGVRPLDPRGRAAGGRDLPGQLLRLERGRGPQQELVDGPLRERVGAQGEDVHPEPGEGHAQRGQTARGVAHGRPHPPQRGLLGTGDPARTAAPGHARRADPRPVLRRVRSARRGAPSPDGERDCAVAPTRCGTPPWPPAPLPTPRAGRARPAGAR